LGRGDLEALTALLHPEVEYHNPDEALEPGIRRGRDAFTQILRGLFATFDYTQFEIERMVEEGEQVGVVLLVRAEGLGSGVSVEQRFGHLLTLQGGRVTRFEWFRDPEGAIRALNAD
jgi:ketosteroid isomerase-like protein